ncbi:MAG: hypothetical protein AB1529_07735 [Candidatus Micrarchaeota archaeon]
MQKGQEGPAGGEKAPESKGVQDVRSDMRRFFVSNATRGQLPPALISRLDDIRGRGIDMLNAIRPYKDASVFDMEFSDQLASDASESGNAAAKDVGQDASGVFKESLEAAVPFMQSKFERFPATDDRDLETTSAIQALFFIGAASAYCPAIILESEDPPEMKKEVGEKFVEFFEKRLAVFMNLGARWANAQTFHSDCFSVYQEFKKEFPGLFQNLRERLWASQAEFMAPYGSEAYDNGWISFHYAGKL